MNSFIDIKTYYDQRAPLQQYPYLENWDVIIKKFARIVDQIVQTHFSKPSSQIQIYDGTCGIGTQAIGMAQLGYKVTASDVAPAMLKLAQKNALERGCHIDFFEQDLRAPPRHEHIETFDVALSINNSLIFLSNEVSGTKELTRAFHGIAQVLKPKGLFLFSLRPYDEYAKTLPSESFNSSWRFRSIHDKLMRFRQNYEWSENRQLLNVHSKYDFMEANGAIHSHHEVVLVRAWRQQEIETALLDAGFQCFKKQIRAEQTSQYRELWYEVQK